MHNECIESTTDINPSVVHKRLKQKSFIHSWFSNNPNRNTLSKKLTIATDTHTHISVFIATCSFTQRYWAHKEANQYLFSPKWSTHVPICARLLLLCLNTLHIHSYLHKIRSAGFQSCPFLWSRLKSMKQNSHGSMIKYDKCSYGGFLDECNDAIVF